MLQGNMICEDQLVSFQPTQHTDNTVYSKRFCMYGLTFCGGIPTHCMEKEEELMNVWSFSITYAVHVQHESIACMQPQHQLWEFVLYFSLTLRVNSSDSPNQLKRGTRWSTHLVVRRNAQEKHLWHFEREKFTWIQLFWPWTMSTDMRVWKPRPPNMAHN